MERRTGFSALICYNDEIPMGDVKALHKLGFNVPRDVSVVGFDDISVQMNFTPSLTSILFDGLAMGARAVNLLAELASDPTSDFEREKVWCHELFPVKLIARESTAPFDPGNKKIW